MKILNLNKFGRLQKLGKGFLAHNLITGKEYFRKSFIEIRRIIRFLGFDQNDFHIQEHDYVIRDLGNKSIETFITGKNLSDCLESYFECLHDEYAFEKFDKYNEEVEEKAIELYHEYGFYDDYMRPKKEMYL